ncbi:hypothetical protein AB0M41_38300 [Streptomyces sp. NPDC051896]|uniref:hypothetical protein n=1 Tax=Streptomyces sp. NPDC051896 TaxID=3155416 RepID=UPI00344874DA
MDVTQGQASQEAEFESEYIDPDGARDDFRHVWGADWLQRLSRYDGLLAIRLNSLGAYAPGRTDAYRPGPEPAAGARSPVRVLPNFDIVALDGLAPPRRCCSTRSPPGPPTVSGRCPPPPC